MTELAARLRRGNRLSLMVDAEGHDDAVLRQFPFATIRPARVQFEANHLGWQLPPAGPAPARAG